MNLMWQRKGRSPEEARRPRLCCRRAKRLFWGIQKPNGGHENSLEWCWFTSRVITDTRFSDKCQKSHAHLLFSHRTSHSIGPLPWNWGERSGETFSFSNNRNRPWIQKANPNLTLSSSQNIFVFLPSIFPCIFNLMAAADGGWQAFPKRALLPPRICSFPWGGSFASWLLVCKM